MQSTNIRQIKAALVDRAFLGNTQVSWPMGPVVAIRRRKGQRRVLIREWGHWYSVESVSIEGAGVALLQEVVPQRLVVGHPANFCKSGTIWASTKQ